jgi:Icc-related predicted phosphoesterase
MKKRLKLWHIGDTHGYHYLLTIPKDIDWVIHSGDFSNYRDVYKNEPEARDFIQWYGSLKIPIKILIAGNHDAYACNGVKEFRKLCDFFNIIYLENENIILDDIKIFGSPNTPNFGNWHFMKNRAKMDKHWSQVDEDVDLLVVHGPPKGILDITENYDRSLEFCGDNALRNHVINRIKPKLCLFGHIHNISDIINAGTRIIPNCDTVFSNGSVVTDRKFGTLSSNGNILKI